MRPIAHRGCPVQYPENTLRAFERSAPVVDMIETDVRRCGSGELVVFHDETLDRVTDTTGDVASTPLAELRSVSVLDSGASIPTVTEVFETVPSAVGLNLELKAAGVAAETVEIAARYDHEVIVSSFRPAEVAAARDAGADSLAFLFHGGERPADEYEIGAALDVAAELDCDYVHPDVALCLETDVVDEAHSRGFGVNAWTIADEAAVRQLRARGVDGAVIDDVELAAVCRSTDSGSETSREPHAGGPDVDEQ
ncbi:glycerophosphodiester phosphodiesterase [Halobellus sp. Atlit-31R]|nr:glycerophosphodiester phosphodiesterase [Halobellus sp. Atlit-31R]